MFVADLAYEHLLQDPDLAPLNGATSPPNSAPTTSPPIPAFRSVEEKLEHVAAGRGIIFLPLSVATFYTRPDITYLEVLDIAPNHVSLAWAATRRSRLIQDFAAIAADHPPIASSADSNPALRSPPGLLSLPGAGSAVRSRLFRFLLAPMRGTVDAGTLLTWRGSGS